MARRLTALALCLVAVSGPLGSKAAPPPVERPHIGYVFPAGGQTGTTFEVKLGGEAIYGATAAMVSGPGVTARIVDARDPREGRSTEAGRKKRRRNQSVIDEVVTLRISIAANASPGNRELCLVAPDGVSDPVLFQVGQLTEYRETEPNDKPEAATPVPALPAVLNGQIQSGDVDTFQFTVSQGQHLVVEVAARALVPYLADAVPGWFQAAISLTDRSGREVAYADDYRFNPDPVLVYDVPVGGEYRLSVRDALYRGRADFVYRIRIGELPFITGLFPLGARRSATPARTQLMGCNLDATSAFVDVDIPTPGVQWVSATHKGLAATPVPFAVDDLPETLATGTDAARPDGQAITPPTVINGCIRRPGQSDTFRFAGVQGQTLRFEVRARRLGSPLDSGLTLLDSRGTVVASNDDVKDPRAGLVTHQADSDLTVTLPSNGTYRIRICDVQGKSGDSHAYRLKIAPPDPDFALRVVPSTLALARGGSTPVTVRAIRSGGCTNAIALALDPTSASGLRLDGGVIPAGTDTVTVTLSATDKTTDGMCFPQFYGAMPVGGTPLTRRAVPAEDLMQAFIYRHLVAEPACVVAVSRERPPFQVIPELGPHGILELPLAKETSFTVKVNRQPGYVEPIRLELIDPPKGITLRKPNIPPGKSSTFITLRTEGKVAAGLSGNLILTAIMMREIEDKGGSRASTPAPKALPGKKTFGPPKERVVAGLAAIPFQIIDPAPQKASDANARDKP